jgi:hypothetical protein
MPYMLSAASERSRFLLLSRTLSSLLRTSDNAKSIDGYTENPPCRMNLLRPCWGTIGGEISLHFLELRG